MKASMMLGLLPGSVALASDIFNVALYAKDSNQLHGLIRRHADIDYGCRPVVMRAESNSEHRLNAIVSEEQLEYLKRSLDPNVVRIDVGQSLQKRQETTAPIGRGDRFKGGKVAPQGLGSRKKGDKKTLGPILNVDEVRSALKGLEREYGLSLFTLPHKTFENRSVYGAVANTAKKLNKKQQYIFLTSGIHARERGGPDNLIYFVSDLLYANKHRKGLTYGNKSYSYGQVRQVLSSGIVFIPLTNPDGVVHDQANSNFWRKNRNTASAVPGDDLSVGVDLNRNFDFLWNYTRYFDPSIQAASSDPSSQVFYGTAPFSEPETRNYASVYDLFPNIRWFMDVHSAAGTLLYSWSDDINQSVDPSQNIFNATFDGVRGIIDDTIYAEYISETDWSNVATQANRTTAAMEAVGGRPYVPQQAVGLYPTSGASDDWAFSRWHKDQSKNKVYSYTLEFALPDASFYPTPEEYINNVLDTSAGFMEFVLGARAIGLKD